MLALHGHRTGAGPGLTRADLTLELAPTAAAPAQARAAVRSLAGGLEPALSDDLELIVSELVTNSAKYGPGESIILRVRLAADKVRGEISDRTSGRIELPPEPAGRRGQVGHWGLPLISSIADAWGLKAGKRGIWFELRRDPL